MDQPGVFNRLNTAICTNHAAQRDVAGVSNKCWMVVSNVSMGGDTRPGHVKTTEIQILDTNTFDCTWYDVGEGGEFPRFFRIFLIQMPIERLMYMMIQPDTNGSLRSYYKRHLANGQV
jgi:hypothetical protein